MVLLDEISFVSIDLIAALETLRLRGTRIICFGDFEQLPPISNRWRGCPVQADVFERSRLFKQWSDCTKFVLTECRRSDEPHFAFYTAVKQRPLTEALADAMQRYPQQPGNAVWNICISHARRRRVNKHIQQQLAEAYQRTHSACSTLKVEGEVGYDCFPGTRLVGCNN